MLVEEITEKNILSVLVGRNIMLPWRCQNDLNIVVPYEVYTSFLRYMVSSGICYLPSGIELYRKALQKGNEILLHRLYLRDISTSIYNEVAISSNYGKDATLISISYKDDYTEITLEEMLCRLNSLGAEAIRDSAEKLNRQCFNCGLVTTKLSEWNLTLYYYSVYLRALTTKKPEKEKLIV